MAPKSGDVSGRVSDHRGISAVRTPTGPAVTTTLPAQVITAPWASAPVSLLLITIPRFLRSLFRIPNPRQRAHRYIHVAAMAERISSDMPVDRRCHMPHNKAFAISRRLVNAH